MGLGKDGEEKEGMLGGLKEGKGKGKVGGELVGMGGRRVYRKLEEYGLKYKFEE